LRSRGFDLQLSQALDVVSSPVAAVAVVLSLTVGRRLVPLPTKVGYQFRFEHLVDCLLRLFFQIDTQQLEHRAWIGHHLLEQPLNIRYRTCDFHGAYLLQVFFVELLKVYAPFFCPSSPFTQDSIHYPKELGFYGDNQDAMVPLSQVSFHQ
jgi:hypothetical protein